MKVVALGDSLTVGETSFESSDSDESPSYPRRLEVLAKHHLTSVQSSLELNVLNKGVNGDLTSGMLERFPRDVIDEEADYVIILGGTNDIGWGINPAAISVNLTAMYDAALSEGIGAVACSVPSILGFDALIPLRLELNRMIRGEAEKREVAFMDLFAITADPATNRLRDDYSADGLHLTAKGYNRIGQYIFDRWLRPLLDRSAR